MGQKKSTFSGIAQTLLLTSVLFFPACHTKPINKRTPIEEKPAMQEVVPQPVSPPPLPAIQNQVTPPPRSVPAVTQQPVSTLRSVQTPMPTRMPTLSRSQIDAGWTPEKVAVVEEYRRNLSGFRGSINKLPKTEIQSILNNLDPMLVGQHVIYDTNWLDYIGPDKQLSQQQFEAWRDRMDIVYSHYKELAGQAPKNGEVIFIGARPKEHFFKKTVYGLAHPHYNAFSINRDTDYFERLLEEIARHNSTGRTPMHEMAHVFAGGRKWETDAECIVHLFVAYAMETDQNIKYGKPNGTGYSRETVKAEHRERIYDAARKSPATNTEELREKCNNIYLLGLIPEVKLDSFKKAIHSYNDPAFEPNEYTSTNDYYGFRIRDFFDRVEFHSGIPGVLKSLPDEGRLLDELDKQYGVQLVQRNLIPLPSTAQQNANIIRQMRYDQER